MSQEPQFLDLVFLAVIVLLLVLRLRSVLGTRPASEEKNRNSVDNDRETSKIVDISEYRTVENVSDATEADNFEKTDNTPEVIQSLRKIKETFPTFNLPDFMQKAPKAFEYIAQAFAAGNKEDLKPLLSADLYKKFEKVIDERIQKGQTAEFSLIGFKKIRLLKAEIIGDFVELTVEFETEQTNLVKDSEGKTIIGDPTYIETVTDIWTLRKDMKTSTPVWILAATRAKA
ncbi:uncharacterized protein BN820_01066 [Acetobacter sp. CAG:977]|nr:uncharacterized protein BN820_01066 [Acetobacter sp. CAG:977]